MSRNGFAATRLHVDVADSSTHRTWRDVAALLAAAGLPDAVRLRAHATFERLAVAEAAVHGTSPEDVHFHEVGALDAIADVVGVCAGLEHLGLDALVVSPVAVGSGRVHGAHGEMPVPPPAVAELLRGVPSLRRTGRARAVHADRRRAADRARHVVRRAAGDDRPGRRGRRRRARPVDARERAAAVRRRGRERRAPNGTDGPLLLETNVDDLDPRLWPNVLAALLAAGASDAWLVPILMKKGRPAHTLHALVSAAHADAVRTEIFRQTSTIGLREIAIGKTALDRDMRTVQVDGHEVHVKLALHNGVVVNAQPEYDDVVRAATMTGRPVKEVLADAVAASRPLVTRTAPRLFRTPWTSRSSP